MRRWSCLFSGWHNGMELSDSLQNPDNGTTVSDAKFEDVFVFDMLVHFSQWRSQNLSIEVWSQTGRSEAQRAEARDLNGQERRMGQRATFPTGVVCILVISAGSLSWHLKLFLPVFDLTNEGSNLHPTNLLDTPLDLVHTGASTMQSMR